jgi:acetyl-CoA carboxylase biotin carboxyl carrier protein
MDRGRIASERTRAPAALARQRDRVHHPAFAAQGRSMPTHVEAQIAGNVWKIEKAVGDAVGVEEVILVIESMKMEIPVEAPCAGRIAEIRVVEGDAIEEGAVLVVIE